MERVCTDSYQGYIQVTRKQLPEAEIVIDRFHVVKNYHEGVVQLRKQELQRLKAELPEFGLRRTQGRDVGVSASLVGSGR